MHFLCGVFKNSSLTTFSVEKAAQRPRNFANFENHNFYFNEARAEVKMLAASKLDFDGQDNKFDVKGAFFGLDAFFSRQKGEPKLLSKLKHEVFSLVVKVC